MAVWLGACSGGHQEDASCDDVSQCRNGAQCLDGLCVDQNSSMTVSASADAVGADVPVLVIDGAGKTCEAKTTCGALPFGTQVTFRAGSAPGYRFTGWTGSAECKGSDVDLVIATLTHDTHCTANYVKRIKVAGHASDTDGGVSATSDSPFAVCTGGTCEVDAGAPVKLKADDRFGQRFTGWSGQGCGSATTFETTVSSTSADLACVANFVERIVVSASAMNASATIDVASEGAVCEPGSCIFDKGGNATLSAPLVPKFRFAGWSGTPACVGSDPVLRLSALSDSQSCVATYAPRVTVSGSASGAEPPPAITAVSADLYARCSGGACDTDVGGTVTLLAGSADGYRLTGWMGPQCDGEKGAAVTLSDVTADTQCSASYAQGIAVIGAVVGAPGEVVASSTTEAAVCAEGGCVIDIGGNVTLTAPSPAGYRFLKWDGDEGCSSTELTISFPSVSQSKTCYARFAARFLVRGSTAPAEGGTVAASSTSAGAVCKDDGCTLDLGGEVVLSATTKDRYRFSGWSGGAACTGTSAALHVTNVQGNTTCQANFIGRFTAGAVSVPATGGTVAASSDSASATCAGATCQVDRGSRVSFTASAAEGYRFVAWSGCSTGSSATITLDNVSQDQICTATFTPLRYTVQSSVAPADSGTVVASATAGNPQCAEGHCTVDWGSAVSLTARPATGWRFGGWSGCTTSDQATIALPSVKADATCQATFQRITFTVAASYTPDNGGNVTITASGPSASCTGLRCTVPYGGGASLRAAPATGWTFGGWSGCSTSMNVALELANISENETCNATFTRQRFDVVGNARPAEGGTVAASSTAQGASCTGSRCTVNYGSAVTLRASANTGYRFSGWSGCTTSNNAEINLTSVTSAQTCTAAFERLTYAVTGSANPAMGGAVMVANNSNATCSGTTCTVQYGGSVTYAAAAATGFALMGWTGCSADPSNAAQAVVANVTGAVNCVANFALRSFRVAAVASTGGNITNATTTSGTCSGAACTVNYGGSATFTAATTSGYDFSGWTGCTASATNPLQATVANVTGAVTCSANFKLASYTVAAVSDNNGTIDGASTPNGTCTGNTCSVTRGGSATFTFVPRTGYQLASFTGGCVVNAAGTAATISNVTSDTTCVANFRPRNYTVTAVASGPGTVTASVGGTPCANNVCTVPYNNSVTVTAAQGTSTFGGWSCNNGQSSSSTSFAVAATNNVTCTATFSVGRATVATRVNVAGRGSATVSGGSAPTCNTDNTSCTVNLGSTVTLTAAPQRNYVFAGWSGCAAAAPTALSTTVSANSSSTICLATFNPVTVKVAGLWTPETVSTAGEPINSVAFSEPLGPNGDQGSCSADANHHWTCAVPIGGSVNMNVTVATGYTIDGISGCTPSNGTIIDQTQARAIWQYRLSSLTTATTCTVSFGIILY
jgi:hypothetical protein